MDLGNGQDAAEARETIQFAITNVLQLKAPDLTTDVRVYTNDFDVAVGVGSFAVARTKGKKGFSVYRVQCYGLDHALELLDAEEIPEDFHDQLGPGVEDEFGNVRAGLLQGMLLWTAVRLAIRLYVEEALSNSFTAYYEQQESRNMARSQRIERDFTYEVEGGEGEVESSIYEVSVTLNGLGEIEEYEAFPYDDIGGLISQPVKFSEEEERRFAAWVLGRLELEENARYDKQMEGPQR